VKVQLARCPDCAAALDAQAVRPLACCPRCPCAVALADGARQPSFRPRGDGAPLRLAFYLFDRESRPPLWIAAFRCFQQATRADLDALLTAAGHAPILEPAPLGALCARSPEQAARVALERQHDPGRCAPRLVSLAVFHDSDSVVEPVTGWRVLRSLLAPAPIEPG
jgi:hypothetical protein